MIKTTSRVTQAPSLLRVPTTHSTNAAEETADTSLEETAETFIEETAETFIEDTATPSIKEEGSKDKNQQSAGKKVLKTEIGEQNVKNKSGKVTQPHYLLL